MAKLSKSVRSSIHQFAYWVANKSVGNPLLEGVDYSCIFEEPSAMQAAFAIYSNVLEVDETGRVLNAKDAERRAAQEIRRYCDPGYVVTPPFEPWEVELP
jgi:hypothetical protein